MAYGFPTRFYGALGFKITSPFGPRTDPFNPGSADFHTGIDYGGRPAGVPVPATIGGTVFAAKSYQGWGNLVGVRDWQNYNHLFAHLRTLLVVPGQTVARGNPVGTLGSTGKATGPHLHYQINRPGTGVNGSGYFGDPDLYFFPEEEVKMESAIVLGSDVDYASAAPLGDALNCPFFSRSALGQLRAVKTVYVCGGSLAPVREAAPEAKLVDLSGTNRFETAAKIYEYLKSSTRRLVVRG
jgi:murein DD-endopeptidase MepM/ murein hydrolase activator NlpD